MMSKGSDINVGSIEEDIEILNSIVKVNKDFLSDIENQTINQKEIKALEHLLSDYTRQKQINEEHQKINGELREKVKELDEENKENKKKYLALLIGQFPNTTGTYKKYKKELEELLQESEDK